MSSAEGALPPRSDHHLAFYTGLTSSQVAHHLGIPVPTAKTRIRDGIKRLDTCLQTN
ncbi:DNA-directed RNA polymerase specialized sigma24 family protein [Arthrobacter sp. CAN_A214]